MTHTPRVAIAAGSRLGVEAGARIARDGGNAVDAAVAAAAMAWVAEPFFTSVAGSGFAAVRGPDGTVEIFDGNVAMPHTPPEQPGQGTVPAFLDYSNGVHTRIGGGAVAVPGVLAALALAWERHGHLEWEALLAPAVEAARSGITFPVPSAFYATVTWGPIWSRYAGARAVLTVDGRAPIAGDHFVQPQLAEALALISTGGPDEFYRGEIGDAIVDAVAAEGGWLTGDDLASYTAEIRPPLIAHAWEWEIATNPPPAVGGAVLAHILTLVADADLSTPHGRTRAIVEAQQAALTYRTENYQDPGGIAAAFAQAIAAIPHRGETTHSSTADVEGLACAITQSAGYGSGLFASGILLNNTLGEEELNPMGVHALPPGARCHSNMTPTIASGAGRAVALGSPGADRIVTAITQTIVRLAVDGAGLAEAIAGPRVHLDMREGRRLLCFEPGIAGEGLGFETRPFDALNLYFGGVQAASVDEKGTLDAAPDPRRGGASALV